MNSSTEFLPPELFSQALEERIDAYPAEQTRLVQLLQKRKCPGPILARYALSTLRSARIFTVSLSTLADTAPTAEARLFLLQNLMEEEGISLKSGKGLIVRGDASHPSLAMRFVKACGIDDNQIDKAPHAVGPGQQMLDEGRWLEAVAFMLVGQELKFATTSGIIYEALLQQGFKSYDLAFFAVHGEIDLRHGQEALKMVVDNAHTVADQRAALAAAEAGAHSWFKHHGGGAKR